APIVAGEIGEVLAFGLVALGVLVVEHRHPGERAAPHRRACRLDAVGRSDRAPRDLAAAGALLARGAARVVALRQIEREGAADAGLAHQLDLAAEQARQLAADRQAQAGAAVLAR